MGIVALPATIIRTQKCRVIRNFKVQTFCDLHTYLHVGNIKPLHDNSLHHHNHQTIGRSAFQMDVEQQQHQHNHANIKQLRDIMIEARSAVAKEMHKEHQFTAKMSSHQPTFLHNLVFRYEK